MKKQCDCITSSKFPHRACKCALNVFSLGKQQTVQNSQPESSVETSSKADMDAADLMSKVSVHVSAENCEIFVDDGENEEQQSNNNIVSITSTRAKQCTCPTSVFFNHRASKCAIFGHPEPKAPQNVEAIVPIYLADSAQRIEREQPVETSTELTSTSTQAQNTTMKPPKAPGDMKCKCINSRLFPHRVRRCALLRAKQSVQSTVNGISHKTVSAVHELELALTSSYEEEFGSSEEDDGDEEDSSGSDCLRDVGSESDSEADEEPDENGEITKRVHMRPTSENTNNSGDGDSSSSTFSQHIERKNNTNTINNTITHTTGNRKQKTHSTQAQLYDHTQNLHHFHSSVQTHSQREKDLEKEQQQEEKEESSDFDDYIRL